MSSLFKSRPSESLFRSNLEVSLKNTSVTAPRLLPLKARLGTHRPVRKDINASPLPFRLPKLKITLRWQSEWNQQKCHSVTSHQCLQSARMSWSTGSSVSRSWLNSLYAPSSLPSLWKKCKMAKAKHKPRSLKMVTSSFLSIMRCTTSTSAQQIPESFWKTRLGYWLSLIHTIPIKSW